MRERKRSSMHNAIMSKPKACRQSLSTCQPATCRLQPNLLMFMLLQEAASKVQRHNENIIRQTSNILTTIAGLCRRRLVCFTPESRRQLQCSLNCCGHPTQVEHGRPRCPQLHPFPQNPGCTKHAQLTVACQRGKSKADVPNTCAPNPSQGAAQRTH